LARAIWDCSRIIRDKSKTVSYKYETILYKYETILYMYKMVLYKYKTILYKYKMILYKYKMATDRSDTARWAPGDKGRSRGGGVKAAGNKQSVSSGVVSYAESSASCFR
jgi:hypothetical protein